MILPLQYLVAQKKSIKALDVDGYYRFLGFHRNIHNLYTNSNIPSTFQANDDFNSPSVNLNLNLTTSSNSNLKIQFFFYDPINSINERKNEFRLGRKTLSIGGGVNTNFGKFDIEYGGINYLRISDLSLSAPKQVRNTLFDRNAWTYVWEPNVQYKNYHNLSEYKREENFGKRDVNGLIINGTKFSNGFEFMLFHGRTPFNVVDFNDNLTAIKIKRKINLNSLNMYHIRSKGIDDLTNGLEFNNFIYGGEYESLINEWRIKSEIALSTYNFEREKINDKDVAFILNITPPLRTSRLPLNAEIYYIGNNYVNIHSSIINSSVQNFSSESSALNGGDIADGARPYGNVMTPMHLKSNNRYGLKLNSDFGFKNLKFNLGYAISKSMNNDTNLVTFFHKVTGLFYSRIDQFQQQTGPFNNLTTFFRGYYEKVYINSNYNYNLSNLFTTSLVNIKYQNELLGKDLFIFYLGEYQSIQNNSLPVPNKKSFVKTYFHEFDLYYNILDNIALIGYFGKEIVKGNKNVGYEYNKLDDNLIDGVGIAIGAGIDISITPKSNLYFRYKNVDYLDKNHENYFYDGYELSAEFKVIF
ncbi:MAG: hypothetical protein CMP70_04430 [Flavobacteriales bacterium]|nr:hypothetical protein [Flavobacteriales bacterium]